MSKLDELNKELCEYEDRYFMLQMCDHWSSEDYRYSDELRSKINSIKDEIKKLESECGLSE